jgi:Leucine-rich repeat (LRR) protein
MCNLVSDIGGCPEQAKAIVLDLLVDWDKRLPLLVKDALDKLGLHDDIVLGLSAALEWGLTTMHTLLANSSITDSSTDDDFVWDACASTCQSTQASWWGLPPECLPNADRSWAAEQSGNMSNGTYGHALEQGHDDACECDERARAWSDSVFVLHGSGLFGAVLFIGLQIWIALMWDDEEVILPLKMLSADGTLMCCCSALLHGNGSILGRLFRAKEQYISAAVSVLLMVSLVRQLDVVAEASHGNNCFTTLHDADEWLMREPLSEEGSLENRNLMLSWVMINITMMVVFLFTCLMPGVYWFLRKEYAEAEAKEEEEERTKFRTARAASTDSATGTMAISSVRTMASVSDVSERGAETSDAAAETRCCRWYHHCCQLWAGRCWRKLQWSAEKGRGAKRAYDELFSFERGAFYVYLRFASEIVEVANQTNQLVSFAQERPFEWIVSLSVVLMLNGVAIPAPFLLARLIPSCSKQIKFILAGADAAFDVLYLSIAVYFSDKESFSRDTWWVATSAVIIPVVGIAFVVGDISEEARNVVVSREWQKQFGTVRPRRQSAMMAQFHSSPAAVSAGKVHSGGDGEGGSGGRVGRERSARTRTGNRHNSVLAVLSVLLAVYCLVCGTIFLRMASEGDTLCRDMLGDALWQGSTPKLVIVKADSGPLREGCNFKAIRHIDSSATAANKVPPMVRIPPVLSRLDGLESLVLSGHNIASDGVPAQILDGIALPRLTRLEFGAEDPVNRILDLHQGGEYLDAFPSHMLHYMNDLESLRLDGTNITCFPPREEFSLLSQLRTLNLSGTRIRYLPPSVLFERTALDVDLSATPVSYSLDWSNHGLAGLSLDFDRDWNRMIRMLPMLESLNVSGNDLRDAPVLNLTGLHHLRYLDVSRNPQLTPPSSDAGFSWWELLSKHSSLKANASFVGLADVGLGPEHVDLQETGLQRSIKSSGVLTCHQLRWLRNTIAPLPVRQGTPVGGDDGRGPENTRLDLSGNSKFASFFSWFNTYRSEMKCDCPRGALCAYVDEAIFYLLFEGLLPNIKSLQIGPIFQKDVAPYTKIVSNSRITEALQGAPRLTKAWMGNAFQGEFPSQIGDLVGLDSLTVDAWWSSNANRLTGEIPETISLLTNLKVLNLWHQNLTGKIPQGVSALLQLTQLDLRFNNLLGPLPIGISALTNLRELLLGFNRRFHGQLPTGISALTNLEALNFDGTSLSGPIPPGITTLTRLTLLHLGKMMRYHPTNVSAVPRRVGGLCLKLENYIENYSDYVYRPCS